MVLIGRRDVVQSALLSVFCAFLLAGCGMGSPADPTVNSAAISGIIHGGPNPVVGATVTLYSTGTTGYGLGSTQLATTTSGAGGTFNFPANSCTPNTEVYATAAGGNSGSGTNLNSLLVAALGDCSNISSSTTVYISEMTTVAAAYALGNFTSISGSGASTVVTIGGPSTNSAQTGSCTGTGSSMTCSAAGLRHAFANALNLASSVTTTAGAPTGLAYSVTPSNPDGVVPATLLNTIADIVQACVNSTGGTSGDSSSCGNLFLNTTPPTTTTTSPITPTNTLQAMINLAKAPTMTASQITALYALSSSSAYFQPNLTTAPHDFSVAIYYTGVNISSTNTAFVYPFYVTIDANDNVYSMDQATSSTGTVTVASMTANGTSQYAGGTITTTSCAAGVPCIVEPDTNGTLWAALGTTTAGSLYSINASTGALITSVAPAASTPVFGVAVDKFNSVFVSVPTAAATSSLYSLASGGSSMSAVQANSANVSETAIPAYLSFDGSGNLWNVDKYTASTATSTSYLANTGTSSTAFAGSAVQTVDDSNTAHGGGYGVVIDSSGVAWINNGGYLFKATGGNTTIASSQIINGAVSASSARYSAIDGKNNIFLPDNNGASASYVWQYFPTTGNFINMLPCAVASATTVCSATAATEAVEGPRNVRVDSTGSLWLTSSTNGHIVQIIGTAAPAWPQLSYGHPGVRP